MDKFIAVGFDYFDAGEVGIGVSNHETLTIATTEEVEYEYTEDWQVDHWTHWSYVVVRESGQIIDGDNAWSPWHC
jgi:hypothetical protein